MGLVSRLITAPRWGGHHISSPLAGPFRARSGQLDVMSNEVTQDPVHTAPACEDVEDELDRVAHSLIGIKDDLAGDLPQISARQRKAELSRVLLCVAGPRRVWPA